MKQYTKSIPLRIRIFVVDSAIIYISDSFVLSKYLVEKLSMIKFYRVLRTRSRKVPHHFGGAGAEKRCSSGPDGSKGDTGIQHGYFSKMALTLWFYCCF
jgi:hypothetical protein